MTNSTAIARDQLRSIVERVERMEEEKKVIVDDIKDIYAEAKANGFDTKTIRTIVRLRKQDEAERQEQEALLDLYMHALGMTTEDPTPAKPKSKSSKKATKFGDDYYSEARLGG